jgi:tRNA U34 5-methylaminomethyl-2-thiouridine-forming methyltransferase MnmC
MHSCNWEQNQFISNNFHLTKRQQFFQDIEDKNQFDLIYFDAFGFPLQPELWSEVIFKKMYDALFPKGTLVTYACRSTIKNAMLSVGFSIEKLPGAPGKREMLRATKNV